MTAHVGLDGRWLKLPPALCELLGYTEEELKARTLAEITHPDDREYDRAQAVRLARGEIDSYELEKRYLTRRAAASGSM
jgi:PAS domain S-box-containing protein